MYHKTNKIIVATAMAVWTFNSPLKAELQSLSFLSSNSVDVSSSEKNIPFIYTASESITHIQIYFRQENPTGFGRFYGWTGSGTKIQVPKFTKPGKWIIDKIDYYPTSGNSTTYARNPSSFQNPLPTGMEQLEVQVANTVTDDVPPTIVNFFIDLEQLRFSYSGGLYAPCTITVEDNVSGFDSASISFTEVSQTTWANASIYSLNKVSGLTNVYKGEIYFINPKEKATYTFQSSLIQDQSGNAIYISSSGQSYNDGYYQINSSSVNGTPFDNLAIELPESFVGLPRDSGYSSGTSSGAGGAAPASGGGSSEKSKKGKKSSPKKSSDKKDNNKSAGKKSEKKSSGGGGDSKKSGGKKKKK
jgi:hypothetical protein